MSIYVVDLSNFNDRSLISAINDAPPNSVILLEDIDCMKRSKTRGKLEEWVNKPEGAPAGEKAEADKLGVTLSGLLNVLDGFRAPENVLFVMTRNKIEVLDPALLRPGRIDFRLLLGKATDRQKVELYARFFPQASEFEAEMFVEDHRRAETMAEFQGLLLALEDTHGNQMPLSETLTR
jgi:mitochondrial chaperone BCS1